MSPFCKGKFVSFSGYKLLRRWIKIAEQDDCITELRMILKICKQLPFDSQAIKESEIGKIIKKLLKYKSYSTDVTSLHEDVRKLVQYWTEQISATSPKPTANSSVVVSNKTETTTTEKLPTVVTSIIEKLKDDKRPKFDIPAESKPMLVHDLTINTQLDSTNSSIKSPMISPALPSSPSAVINKTSVGSTSLSWLTSATEKINSTITPTSSNIPYVREKRAINTTNIMAEEAKRQLSILKEKSKEITGDTSEIITSKVEVSIISSND